MKRKHLLIGGGIIVVLAVIILVLITMANLPKTTYYNNNNTNKDQNVQIVKMKVVGANYVFEPSIVESGKPVRIEADMRSVVGCARSVVIPAYSISKYISENDNIVTFTPTKSGTINIACSMNMYKGQLEVK